MRSQSPNGARFLKVSLAVMAAGLLPQVLWAHGAEVIMARVDLLAKEVRVELTADYANNPMLHSEEDAKEVLSEVLSVRIGQEARALRDWNPLTWERRTESDPTFPLADGPHQAQSLLTAVWTFKPGGREMVFEVPQGNPHNVVLWTLEPKASWFLIAGDRSPGFHIPKAPTPWWLVAVGSALAIAAGWFALRKKAVGQSAAIDPGDREWRL